MTREEKISHLKGILSEINENDNAVCYLTSEDSELIESAIEALEQEPCEDAISRKAVTDTSICEGISCNECSFGKDFEYGFSECQLKKRVDALPSVQPKLIECEDAISRNIAVANVQELAKLHPNDSNNLNKVVKCLETLPPVTPQPKIGHWIKYGIPRCGEQHYKCTNCDEYFNFGLYSDYYKKAFKFCPNCGCRMVEPQESEE